MKKRNGEREKQREHSALVVFGKVEKWKEKGR